jgi:hypothetical protein
MNRFSKNFAVFLLASIILLSNAWAHHYRIIGHSATNLASAPLEAVRSIVLGSEYELDDYTFPSNHLSVTKTD